MKKHEQRRSCGPPDPGSGQLTSVNAWRQNMRIRRNILAPAILTVGPIGSLVAGPVLALTTTAAPATAAVAISATPNLTIMHGRNNHAGGRPAHYSLNRRLAAFFGL